MGLTAALGIAPACVGAEPDFHAESLREPADSGDHESLDDDVVVIDDGAPPDLELLRAEGLEGTLSEGTPPPPFMPDDAHYPAVEIGGSFDVAVHAGAAQLVDVLSSEQGERGELITVRDVLTSEESAIVLPTNYQCSTATSVVEGRRYVILTSAPGHDEPPSLYLGVGSEFAILPVEEGWVRTPDGGREAESVVAESRRGS